MRIEALADADSVAGAGGEHSLCVKYRPRVVSMPSWEIFERQPQEYRITCCSLG